MTHEQELEVAREWVHRATDACQDIDTLDLVGKLMLYEQSEQEHARPHGGGVVIPLLFGVRMAAK